MDTDSTVAVGALPQYHSQPVVQGPITYWQRCRYNIMIPLRAFWKLHKLYPLGETTFLYTLAIFAPSAPPFDIFTLYETRQGCITLFMLLLIWTLFLQRLHTIEEHWQWQNVLLGSVALIILLAWLLLDTIKFVIEIGGFEKIPAGPALIPIISALLLILWEGILVFAGAGWAYAVSWPEFLLAKSWDFLAGLMRPIGYIFRPRPKL